MSRNYRGDSPGYDQQGEMTDDERVAIATQSFVRDFDRASALYMEACVHCGMCSEACHFFEGTQDPRYTPIYKLEPFKRAYRREVGPFSAIARMFTKPVQIDELREWQHYLYDSCTMCGRCTMVCPMGIDIATLIGNARHGMFRAGLAPARLAQIADNAERKGGSQSATPAEFVQVIHDVEREHGVTLPLDQEADVLITVAAGMLEGHGKDIARIARILDHVGMSYTLSEKGYEATNFGMLSGNVDLQRHFTMRLVTAAIDNKVKMVLLPECGHAYGAMKWKGPTWYGKRFPFDVWHMSEFLGRMVEQGRLKVKKLDHGSVTFHDPCQAGRRGGIFEEPRTVMQALGLEVREMESGGVYNYCCGGGGGALANFRNEDLRAAAFKIKMKQVEDTEADGVVSACHQCHITFNRGKEHHNWDVPFESLMHLVADNLDEG